MHINRIRNAVILISMGVVFLLNTTDKLSWEVWWRILSLWPIILVAIGIELLFKKTRLSLLAIISPLLFLVMILGPAVFIEKDFSPIHRTGDTYLWSQDLDSTLTKVTAVIDLKAGNLELSSGTDKLISAELDYHQRKPVATYDYSSSDSSSVIEITDDERVHRGWSLFKGWHWGEYGRKDWKIRLTDRVLLDLKLNCQAGHLDLDLSDLKVNDFELDAKASKIVIRIGDLVNEVSGKIDAKATKLSISFPQGMGLKIENHAKVSSTSFSHISLKETEDGYQTPDFDQTQRKLILYLDGSAVKLQIDQYQSAEGI